MLFICIRRCCIPWYTLYIWCCICQARDSSDSSSIGQRCSQNDRVMPWGRKWIVMPWNERMETWSRWANACKHFWFEGRKIRIKMKWWRVRQANINGAIGAQICMGMVKWSMTNWPSSFCRLSYMLVSFYSWFSMELCSLSSSTVSTQSDLCAHKHFPLHSFAV